MRIYITIIFYVCGCVRLYVCVCNYVRALRIYYIHTPYELSLTNERKNFSFSREGKKAGLKHMLKRIFKN